MEEKVSNEISNSAIVISDSLEREFKIYFSKYHRIYDNVRPSNPFLKFKLQEQKTLRLTFFHNFGLLFDFMNDKTIPARFKGIVEKVIPTDVIRRRGEHKTYKEATHSEYANSFCEWNIPLSTISYLSQTGKYPKIHDFFVELNRVDGIPLEEYCENWVDRLLQEEIKL